MFTIGHFARLAGVSAKVLRRYDALGMFRPIWIDRDTSYRYYSPAQLPELRRILALRDLGLGLDEIRTLIVDGADLASALQRRRMALEDERREADRRLAALDIHVELDGHSDVVTRPVPAVRIAKMTLERRDDVEAAFYRLEACIRDLRRRAQGPPGSIERPDGTEIFVPIRGVVPTEDGISVERLAACSVATVLHRGPYEALGATRSTLFEWVASSGLEVAGPLRVLYLQFGAESELRVPPSYVVTRSADYLTELQLPVTWPRAEPGADRRRRPGG